MTDDSSVAAAVAPPHVPAQSLYVHALDLDAQGVAHRSDGKVVFIEGALPTEWVSAQARRSKKNWEAATLTAIHCASSLRVAPACAHFGLHQGACGGCKMQHLHADAQVAIKQRALEDALWHLGKCKPDLVLRPMHGPSWGYRHRARLSVRYVAKKGEVLIGFHERNSRYIADMRSCAILPPQVSRLLLPLRALIGSLQARESSPQIELACGDDGVIALVLRHLEPLGAPDIDKLHAFAAAHAGVQWWLQPKGPETAHCITPHAPPLAYRLPEWGITLPFAPTDFTQVNPHINRALVAQALQWLAVQRHERVIDWFCGLGNFSLPLAAQAREVLGAEGSPALVARAAACHAAHPHLARAQFIEHNLFEMTPQTLLACGAADKWLIDPPREGALALIKSLCALAQDPACAPHWHMPQRIVYVSCKPATLARDAGLLVHQGGYRLVAAGVVNMFPHTAHVESMAVFERPPTTPLEPCA